MLPLLAYRCIAPPYPSVTARLFRIAEDGLYKFAAGSTLCRRTLDLARQVAIACRQPYVGIPTGMDNRFRLLLSVVLLSFSRAEKYVSHGELKYPHAAAAHSVPIGYLPLSLRRTSMVKADRTE